MELIQERILRIMTTGTTTGCTPCAVIIPNTNVNYYFKINLTSESPDIGFFDAATSGSSLNSNDEFLLTSLLVTGASTSRLTELRKYAITDVFSNQYFNNGSTTNDGVDLYNSIPNQKIVYYLGGIRYVDIVDSSGITTSTTFSFIGQGYNSPNFINTSYYQNPNKENIISNPKIYDDVFIVRQELSAFDKNYRLEYVRNLVDLTTYAAGSFFNIVNNT